MAKIVDGTLVIDNAVIDSANERISAGYSVPAAAQLQ